MFYDNLDKLCAERGISVSGLLDTIDVSRSAAVRWKSKGYNPAKPIAKKIADYFGITVAELMSGETKKEPITNKSDKPSEKASKLVNGLKEAGIDIDSFSQSDFDKFFEMTKVFFSK
jgi:transcriptional regulator with XRE-family HTH domain